ncbi:hypothetical protein [Spirillospora sp. CA-128828]
MIPNGLVVHGAHAHVDVDVGQQVWTLRIGQQPHHRFISARPQ